MQEVDVLIVEDDESIVELVTSVLEEYGYSSCSATSGQEALATAQQCRPRVVLLDLILPDMSALDLIAQLRQSRRLDSVPIVIMSGMRDLPDQASAIGAADYLIKPFSIDDLVRLIERYTGHTPRTA